MDKQDKEYLVSWEIDVSADNFLHAVEQAREIQLDPDSTATVFKVINHETKQEYNVDLQEGQTSDLYQQKVDAELILTEQMKQDIKKLGIETVQRIIDIYANPACRASMRRILQKVLEENKE